MLHDRSLLGDHPLRYVILFGRTTQDNCGITAGAPSYPTIPSWMPEGVAASLSDNSGYCTDDVTAMLDDGPARHSPHRSSPSPSDAYPSRRSPRPAT